MGLFGDVVRQLVMGPNSQAPQPSLQTQIYELQQRVTILENALANFLQQLDEDIEQFENSRVVQDSYHLPQPPTMPPPQT